MIANKISKEEFKQQLYKYNLSANLFLDLRDQWNLLSAKDKVALLKEDYQEYEFNKERN